jgi:hypothetical protein
MNTEGNEERKTATPVYPYAYNRSEQINQRIRDLAEWLGMDIKSVLDEAINRMYESLKDYHLNEKTDEK